MVDQRYDPDNPPEEAPRELVGLVITSAYVTSEAEANAIDPTLGERYRKFNESFVTDTGIQNPECWVQRIQASKLVYEDTGELLVFSQLVRTVNKKGQPLPQGQAPSLLATQYREATGKRASPLAVGQEDSIVDSGIYVRFMEHEVPLGKGYSKTFRLWPVEVVAAAEVEAMPVQTVTRSTDSENVEADTAASAGPRPSEEEAVRILGETLKGKTPAEMLSAILDEPRLKNVSSVFGTDLMTAATDETLADILVNNGVFSLDAGKLVTA